MKTSFCLWLLVSLAALCQGDTPANCFYRDIEGTWTIFESERVGDSTTSCDDNFDPTYVKKFTLEFPNLVVDELGNTGTWTMVYNQGFEININERSYFAYSYYKGDYQQSVSFCDRTFNGWARDVTVRNWSCFTAFKNTPVEKRITTYEFPANGDLSFKNDLIMIEKVNKLETTWTAKEYPEWEKFTRHEMFLRSGGPGIISEERPSPTPPTAALKKRVAHLPKNFDWRNVDGVNFVSPVRDQKNCGSCYAFASMANIEANLRIASENQRHDIFAPQDPLSCSYLDQGCMGGFDYLVAGRYGMEQGFVHEDCSPYEGQDGVCTTDESCKRTFVSHYEHVGGYYGACNEELMLETIVEKGPISVSFEVYDDFRYYEGGIYYHTEVRNEFDPFEITNHVVLIVGYGEEEETGEKFWTVKNSWGEAFGENGYFRIRRGTDECGIESMAVTITVIP